MVTTRQFELALRAASLKRHELGTAGAIVEKDLATWNKLIGGPGRLREC
jgi:hypothetical protein